jgi:RNA polymerase sigma-70 factor (ECF subfamily)
MESTTKAKNNGKEGNGAAVRNEILKNFMREYGKRAFKLAYKLSGNVEDAKELVQEASYRVLLAWDRYDESKSLQGWFFSILWNGFVDSQRRLKQQKWVAMDAPVDGREGACYGDILSDGDGDLAQCMEDAEAVRTVRQALAHLSAEQRAVIYLCEIRGMNYEDIAQSLGVPVGTVRSRIFRARRELRKQSGLAGFA